MEIRYKPISAAQHLKRGYCCKNKCFHCPWNYKLLEGLSDMAKHLPKGMLKEKAAIAALKAKNKAKKKNEGTFTSGAKRVAQGVAKTLKSGAKRGKQAPRMTQNRGR